MQKSCLQVLRLPLDDMSMVSVNLEVSRVQITKAANTYLVFPNPPVWEFEVHVALSVAKNVFKAHSAMKWNEFEQKVLKNLDGVILPVQLAYRVSGDLGKMSYLRDEEDWVSALAHIDTKVPLARKNPVSLEVRNLVSVDNDSPEKWLTSSRPSQHRKTRMRRRNARIAMASLHLRKMI